MRSGGELSIGGRDVPHRRRRAAQERLRRPPRRPRRRAIRRRPRRGGGARQRVATAPPLPEGAYYHYQLIGLAVAGADGAPLGVLTEVLRTGANDVYVVLSEGAELLVPAVADVIRVVDTERGVMTVALPDGLEPRAVNPPKPKRRRARGGAGRAAKR